MSTEYSSKRAGLIGDDSPLRRKGLGLCSRFVLMSTGTWTSRISTWAGRFYYLTSLLDGYSRFIVHWEICESMTERDVETIVQRALEQHPNQKPRIISDNGPQFIARDFKEFIRVAGITHVRTSPHYPQSNGKLERWHGSLKSECVRPAGLSSLCEAAKRITTYVEYYNARCLHSALNYLTPADKLAGLEEIIFAERDRKLEEARERRAVARRNGLVVA